MPAIASPSPSTRTVRTRGELITRVRRDLAMLTSSLYADDEVGDWLNEGQERFARETQWFRAGYQMDAVEDQAEYDLPSSATGRCLMIEEVWFNDQRLAATSIARVRAGSPNWRNESGTPFSYFLRGASSFYLYPTPDDDDTNAIVVYFAALPPHVTADGDQFYLPHGFEDYLLNYAEWRASMKDRSGEGGQRVADFERLWKEDLERGKQKVQEADNQEVVSMGEEAVYGGPVALGYLPLFTNIQAPP